jgi:O-antigen ligase
MPKLLEAGASRYPGRSSAAARWQETAAFAVMMALILSAGFSVIVFQSQSPYRRTFLVDLLLECGTIALAIALTYRKLNMSLAGWIAVSGSVLLIIDAAAIYSIKAAMGTLQDSPFEVVRVMAPAIAIFLAIDTGVFPRRGLAKAMVLAFTGLFLAETLHWIDKGALSINSTIIHSSINYFLACGTLLLFASIYVLFHEAYSWIWNGLALVNVALFSFHIIVSGSRTSFGVACVIALFFGVVMLTSKRKGLFLVLLATVLLGFAAAAVCYQEDVAGCVDSINRLLSLFNVVPTPTTVSGSDFVRWDLWEAAIKTILRPDGFFGGGSFDFPVGSNGKTAPAHNFILEILVSIGLPGLILFLSTTTAILVLSIRNTSGWRNIFALFLPILIFFGFGFFHPFVSTGVLANVLFWTWLGFGLKENVWKWVKQ